MRYVHRRRQSRRNSLSKMEYKIVKRKSLRTQSPNTPKSHYHTIEILPQKEKTKEKTRIQTSLLLGGSFLSLLFSLTVQLFLSSFSLQRRHSLLISLCGALRKNQEERQHNFSLAPQHYKNKKNSNCAAPLDTNHKRLNNVPFIKLESRLTIQVG